MVPQGSGGRISVTRTFAAAVALFAGLTFSAALPAFAASSGDDNKGDVWVDNVGQPSGPGHENDPHLACADINIWGDKMADPSGTFTIDGWDPSGSGAGDQAWPGTKANPGTATWTYDQSTGGSQVIAVINVHTLIANAVANGDTAQAQQGYHFKLQLSQDPQKHKVFWVNCAAPASSPPASPPSSPGGGVGGVGGTPSTTPSGAAGGVSGASGAAGAVQAASTVGLPSAGTEGAERSSLALGAIAALIALSGLLAVPRVRRALWPGR